MRECVHMHSVLTGTVFFALVLGHRYLPVYDGLRLQDILVMAVGQGLMIDRDMRRESTDPVGSACH